MRFLFVDRIVHLSPGTLVRGIKHINPEDAWLTVDEQGKACFIPSLIGETLGQLAAWNVMHHNQFTSRPVAGVVASARLYRPAWVGETLLLESYIDELDDKVVQYHSVARVGDEIVFTIEGALGPLLPMADFIATDEVKQQFDQIYKPGEWATIHSTAAQGEIPCGNSSTIPMIFDRILASEPGVSLIAEKQVNQAAPYFPDHFPEKPVLPLTVLLECKLNLAKEFIMRAGLPGVYQVSELRKIKMNEFVQPGAVIVCYVKVKEQNDEKMILTFRSEVDGKRVCVLEIVLKVIPYEEKSSNNRYGGCVAAWQYGTVYLG